MAIAVRESLQKRSLQPDRRRRLDGIEAILLVDGLPPRDFPDTAALLEEVVEAPRARYVDEDAVDFRALHDRHFRLRDRARADDLTGKAAERMQDQDAALEAVAAGGYEIGRRSVKPGRAHHGVGVPHGREALPVAGVAPHDPLLDHFPDLG